MPAPPKTGLEFDPGAVAVKNGRYFGFPYELDEAEIVLLPVPWDVTTSYGDGTSRGPAAILEASYQLDFTSPYRERAWETRIGTVPASSAWLRKNKALRAQAKKVIAAQERGQKADSRALAKPLAALNESIEAFHREVELEAARWLEAGKRVVTVGGDHSVSVGPVRALAKRRTFSILHIDAHADLRVAYEGFTHSHASIMSHLVALPSVEKLVQVGLRDVSPEELEQTRANPKIAAHFDWDLRRKTAQGTPWAQVCREIVEPLGGQVYLSVDIDGLDPRYCPGTGTPVPGGLELWELMALLEAVQASGRRFIGADVVEVAPSAKDEWDANVGARLLFQICQFVRNGL